jgi:hypothetical protein
MAPTGRMAAWNTEEGAEAQLAPGHRHWVTVMRTVPDFMQLVCQRSVSTRMSTPLPRVVL